MVSHKSPEGRGYPARDEHSVGGIRRGKDGKKWIVVSRKDNTLKWVHYKPTNKQHKKLRQLLLKSKSRIPKRSRRSRSRKRKRRSRSRKRRSRSRSRKRRSRSRSRKRRSRSRKK
jgi:arginine/serine-rich splicing factor 12